MSNVAVPAQTAPNVAPGSIVVVRDETWLVTHVSRNDDGLLVTVQGLSELVSGTTAQFSQGLDTIEVLDPAKSKVVADGSPGYRTSRLWLEATFRKAPMAIESPALGVVDGMLADSLAYQRTAVRTALNPDMPRPRLLLADTVGLGKTLEIGMILSELIRRGQGERILIVTPRHVLEQMQQEMWTRFAIPFVRLDSVGIQQVRRRVPASRNPFSVYKRAIISIDTLKSDRYLAHLRRHRWNAVVIDESHNITNSATQNNRLASALAPQTEALILASATPHNGRAESFAELIRLLDPTAVSPEGELDRDAVKRLVVRRHRHSPEVAQIVGANWAERQKPVNRLVDASPAEDAIADELASTWLYSPERTGADALFGWTLAKAFLSSPAALAQTVSDRLRRGTSAGVAERTSLEHLAELAEKAEVEQGGKYAALREELDRIGIGPKSPERVVIFAERVGTLEWLVTQLRKDLKLAADQIAVLHGGLSDTDQQQVVEQFKQAGSPLRVLVTGDVASEGVNLHQQCHELIHFDIPWSLIRIEQRNGRIDRYGQRHSPRITTLLLNPSADRFSGDLRVLTRLMEREHEAHTALGDSASLMGQHDVAAEERAIRDVLRGRKDFDDAVKNVSAVQTGEDLAALLANLEGQVTARRTARAAEAEAAEELPLATGLYEAPVDYLREAVQAVYARPEQDPTEKGGGIAWRDHRADHLVEFAPPADLRARLQVLPQDYLREAEVMQRLRLVTSATRGTTMLREALSSETSTWPAAHFLGPLHPVLDWASDRALATLGRGEIYAVRGTVDAPAVLVMGTLLNSGGKTITSALVQVDFPSGGPGLALASTHATAREMFDAVGVGPQMSNPGPVADVADLTRLVPVAVEQAGDYLESIARSAAATAEARVRNWQDRVRDWTHEAEALVQRRDVVRRRETVDEQRRFLEARTPAQSHLRPLLVVVPADHPVADATTENGES